MTRLANEHALHTIAFPSLGTGAYGYPVDEAAPIAFKAVREHFAGTTSLQRVTFVLFSEGDLAAYRHAAARTSEQQR